MLDKRDKDTKRTSFDLQKENSELLNIYAKKAGSSFSRVVNHMIRIFMAVSPNVKTSIADFCDAKIKEIQAEMPTKGEFEKKECQKMISEYQQMAYFFRDGEEPKKKESRKRRRRRRL